MSKQILSVTQINEYIRSLMDNSSVLLNVAIQGEISNYKVYPSGHHYFTLKDEGATLKCVMFRSAAVKLRFRPDNGQKVIALGRITVYPRDGAYQLYCTAMMADGAGDLHAAFEQLKAKLAAKGLFDPQHKKPIPKYPGTIAIITSAAGAAVHDMLRILRKRYPLTQVRLLPVRVQGAEAPAEIAAAITYANAHKLADVLIVGRGGGSLEDLWAFNDERVAQAIYDSQIPVISAVGHEPDVTISDYVADLRAATPSNAAELVTPDRNDLRQMLDSMSSAMISVQSRQLKHYRQQFSILAQSSALLSPFSYVEHHRKNLSLLKSRFFAAQEASLSIKKQKFVALTSKLDAMSPLKVLTRGYSVVTDKDNNIITKINDVSEGQQILLTVSDGTISATVNDFKENSR